MLLIGESTKAFFAILYGGEWVLLLVVEAVIDAVVNPKIGTFPFHCSVGRQILPAFTVHSG